MKKINQHKIRLCIAVATFSLLLHQSYALAIIVPNGANLNTYFDSNGTYDLQGDASFSYGPKTYYAIGNQVFNGAANTSSTITINNESYFLVLSPSSTWTLNNITFTGGNNNLDGGGVISVRDYNFVISGNSAAFINNHAYNNGGASGGAIHVLRGDLTLNTQNFLAQGNTGGGSGGAIWTTGSITVNGNLSVINNEAGLTGNAQAGGYGGGVRTDSFYTYGDNEIKFIDNKTKIGGGGMTLGTALISEGRLTVKGNLSNEHGGGFRSLDPGSYISLNNPNATHFFEDNTAAFSGGAIAINDRLDISGSIEFNKNLAGETGGAIFIGTVSDPSVTSSQITLGNNNARIRFEDNSAGVAKTTVGLTGRGGAVYSQGGLSLEGGQIDVLGNQAMADAGAFYVAEQFSLLGTFDINNNHAGVSATGSGGALYSTGDLSVIARGSSSFTNNSASAFGGALYLGASTARQGSLRAEGGDITFSGNRDQVTVAGAVGSANAIYIDNPDYTLNISANSDYGVYFYDPLSSASTGQVQLNINDGGQTGRVVFSGENFAAGSSDLWSSVSAQTTVQAGQFVIKDNARFGNASAQSFSVRLGAHLSSVASDSNVINQLQAAQFAIDGTLSFSGERQRLEMVGDVAATGELSMRNNRIGDVLFIQGDYHGQDATLTLDTFVDVDGSPSDQLIITGQATGSSHVLVENLGGSGASARNGILLVETGSSAADAFTLPGGYVSVGVFDYSLQMRNENGQDNWYLFNSAPTPREGPEVIPPTEPTSFGTPPTLFSPDLGSFIANQRAGNNLFKLRLEDREGATNLSLHPRSELSPWIRYETEKNWLKAGQQQIKSNGRASVTQVGIPLLSWGQNTRMDIGLMGAYGDYKSSSHSVVTGRQSKSNIHGYSVGGYATWYAKAEAEQSWYIDTWLQWNEFDNSINTADGAKQKYTSSGLTASLESGVDLQIGTLENSALWLQPQVQFIYQGVKADRFRDRQGIEVESGKANLQSRLGANFYLSYHVDELGTYQPYIAANWIHNSNAHAINAEEINYRAQGANQLGELKLGVEGQLSKHNQLWLNTAYQRGSDSYKTHRFDIGWKYSF